MAIAKHEPRAKRSRNLPRWVRREFGLDPWWTCYQFDSAVCWFGSWLEGQLSETDEKGRPVYASVKDVLDGVMNPGKKTAEMVNTFRAAGLVVKR